MQNVNEADLEDKIAHVRRIAYSVVAPTIVGIGILGNILNLFVLTRSFLKGGTRIFLLGLAVSDLSVMITVIPMVIRLNRIHGSSYSSAFFHAHLEILLTNIFIATSVFTVVCLTIERYLSVCYPLLFRNVHTRKNAKKYVISCYLIGFVVSIPLICLKVVCKKKQTDDCELWDFQENKEATSTIYWNIYLWISEVLVRFGPCIVLATLNILIIKKFRQIAAKRKFLRLALAQGKNRNDLSFNMDPSLRRSLKNKRYQEEKRIIRLLRAIVILFFVTMTPSAILSLLYSENQEYTYSFQIFRAVANNLELSNFALNFYVYCLCSREFRSALFKVMTGCFSCEDEQSDVENDGENENHVLSVIKITDFDTTDTKSSVK